MKCYLISNPLYMVTLTKCPSAILRGHVPLNHVHKKASRS